MRKLFIDKVIQLIEKKRSQTADSKINKNILTLINLHSGLVQASMHPVSQRQEKNNKTC